MWKKGIRVIVSFAVVLLVWQIACTVTNANATLFPSPVKVGEEFVKLFTQGLEGSTSHVTLPGHIRISLLRFATGYVLAAVSAILLGLILGSLPKVFQFINPILQIIRPIAPVHRNTSDKAPALHTWCIPPDASLPAFYLPFG